LPRVTEVLDDRHDVGKCLVRVVDVALHVQHGHAARLGHVAHVLVARPPVALADGDAVVVTTQDLADLLGRVAVGDLGGLGLDELGVPPELCHARLERGTGTGAREEEEHREDLVPQVGMGLTEGARPFQGERNVEKRVELVLGEVLERDHVATAEMCLHGSSYSIAPRTSESRAIRMTTPLKASTQ
jgi:hypothetical protein